MFYHNQYVRFVWKVMCCVILLALLAACGAPTGSASQPPAKATVVTTLSPSPTSTSKPVSANHYGIAAGGWYGSGYDTLLQNMRDVASTGASNVRMDFEWPRLEPQQGAYNWAAMEDEVKAARANKLSILGIIDYTPSWAAAQICTNPSNFIMCQPRTPQLFARFASTVAQHFLSLGVHEWEIWNEENSSSFWEPSPNPVFYAQLFRASYQAIKEIDDNAVVITGGLAPNGEDSGCDCIPDHFIRSLIDNGIGSLDGIGDHPNTYPVLASQDPGGAWQQMVHIHALLSSRNIQAPIWITELSAPSGPDVSQQQTPEHQAAILQDGLNLAATYAWVARVYVFTLYDYPSTNVEGYFGLVDVHGRHKLAWSVFKKATQTVS